MPAEENTHVAAFISALSQETASAPPPPPPPPPAVELSGVLHYYSERHGTQEEVPVEDIVSRIVSEKGEHYIIKDGLHSDWTSWKDFPPLVKAVEKARSKRRLPPPPGRRLPPPPKS